MPETWNPVTMTKGSEIMIADTRAVYFDLLWDGWRAGVPVPVLGKFDTITRDELEEALAVPDTGWRRIEPNDGNSPGVSAALYLRRIGDIVKCYVDADLESLGTAGFNTHDGAMPRYLLPDFGWNPGYEHNGAVRARFPLADEDGFVQRQITVSGDGTIQIVPSNGVGGPMIVGGLAEWTTSEPFPAVDSLIGEQVTPPSMIQRSSNQPVGLADTGIREVIIPGAGANALTVHFQRVGNQVEIQASYQEYDPGAGFSMEFLPVGWIPSGDAPITTHLNVDDNTPSDGGQANEVDAEASNYAMVTGDGAVSVYYGMGYGSFRLTYLTSDPWPTAPLGTEVTPARVQPVQPVNLPEVRDTGTRLVSYEQAQVTNPGVGFTHFVRRVGNLVSLWTPDAAFSISPGDVKNLAAMLAVGFRPSADFYAPLALGYPRTYVNVNTGGGLTIANDGADEADDTGLGMLTFPTDDPFPTVLPGSPYPS